MCHDFVINGQILFILGQKKIHDKSDIFISMTLTVYYLVYQGKIIEYN